ncbi:DUF4251 domain-containing protein [Flagellimonas sp. CMM7]|uniref:DUF4251 domain-containing protein n=1 Tax=Flagellimonas sp. CMM7 TaxID=2654676 RepID=UPI0013D06756|nr:DUF4251 domain-containing protein [Flagellimonas sp. CMM7]UII79492.1 DUF4251 domain-containing protein [Flagellimonas sp. CMM7]
MKTFGKYIWSMLIIVVAGCASNPKPSATAQEIEVLNNLVSGRSFEIKANWANPLATGSINSIANAGLLPNGSTANRIDLSGSASYLKVIGDKVEANLPYFGERQMGGTYNSNNTGIQFEGVPKSFEIVPNQKTRGYTMRFTISSATETYQVMAELTPSLSSNLNINSTHRTAIWYTGRVEQYDKE